MIRLGVSAVLDGVTDIRIIGEADSGPKLWELLKKITPDIVMLDITMHDFDVLEAIRRLRQEYPQIRIIIVTFHDEEKYVLHTTNLGVDGYLIKEEPAAEYIKAIRIVARGGTYRRACYSGLLTAARWSTHSTPAPGPSLPGRSWAEPCWIVHSSTTTSASSGPRWLGWSRIGMDGACAPRQGWRIAQISWSAPTECGALCASRWQGRSHAGT
jgi:CheY-like chemotaxis protein